MPQSLERKREVYWQNKGCDPPPVSFCAHLPCGKKLGAKNKVGYCYKHRHLSSQRKAAAAPLIKEWAKKNPLKRQILTSLNNARTRAKRDKVAFDATAIEVLYAGWTDADVVFGTTVSCGHFAKSHIGEGSGTYSDSISVDRMTPYLGYIVGNVRLVCLRCNAKKGSLTVEEAAAGIKTMHMKLGPDRQPYRKIRNPATGEWEYDFDS
jgi:hypothetical protein